jgi:oxygenase
MDTEIDTQVIVVGAGPVGLMLAGELRLGGAEVVVVERREAPTTESRASTLHARTMELLDSRGLLEAFGELPNEPRGHFGGIPLDLTLPSSHPGQWKVPQTRTEQLLGEWAIGSGARVLRGRDVREVTAGGDEDGVSILVDTPSGQVRMRARYLVACDGQDSTVRELTGAHFPGRSATRELLRADVADIEIPNRKFERLEHGLAIAARNNAGITRVMVHKFGSKARTGTADPDFGEIVDAWKRVTGEDISGGEPLWVGSFGDANRQLAQYRTGRVLFAGDAAHQQMPIGGQALNLGLQDAVNLGWKLAATVRGQAPAGLLDTYHSERHAVGERVLGNIRAQAQLLLGDAEVEPLRRLIAELIGEEANRVRLAEMISGLDIRYPVSGGEHPMLGARLPDTDVPVPGGSTTTTALLRTGRGLFLDCAGGELARPWADRVTAVTARQIGSGPPHPAGAVLVRPDGYVAWIGPEPEQARIALHRWFGRPTGSAPTR